jgi:microcystin-dependent protein
MADPTTSNRGFNIPTTGSDVGTWGTSLNNNFSYIDQLFGGVVIKSLTGVSGNLTLSSSDVQYGVVRLTGTLGANVNILLPTASNIYTIEALPSSITGAYTITASMAAGAVVGIAPGIPVQIFTDGSNTKFYNPPLPGTYWDYAGSATPGWITACTNAPWLACDGSPVSRSTYSYLFNAIGTTFGAGDGSTTFNLPDTRNRARVSVMSSGARLTSAVSGIDGTVVGSGGSTSESTTLTYGQIPPHTHSAYINDPGHTHNLLFYPEAQQNFGNAPANQVNNNFGSAYSGWIQSSTTGVQVKSTSGGAADNSTASSGGALSPGGTAHTNVQPTIVAGLTFIKT